MDIKKIIVGQIEANCYLIISNNELAVVDPGDEYEKIVAEIEKLGDVDYKYILLTHGHFDHVGAVRDLKEKYGFQIVLSEEEKNLYEDVKGQEELSGMSFEYQGNSDIWVKDGDILGFGGEKIKVIETPGHTAGSVSYLIGDNLFSGDMLFRHTHGRTDLPGGSSEDMKKSLEKLLKLEKEIKVFPGHGAETSIGEEREYYA